jgi:hypothetical protein
MRWLAVLVLMAAVARPAVARDVNRKYTDERLAGEDESYETAYKALCLRMQRRFIEEMCGSLVQSMSEFRYDGEAQAYAERVQSLALGHVRVRVLNGDEVRRTFRDNGGLVRITAVLSISKDDLDWVQSTLQHERALRAEEMSRALVPTPVAGREAAPADLPAAAPGTRKARFHVSMTLFAGPEHGYELPRPAFCGALATEWSCRPVGVEFGIFSISSHSAQDLPPGPTMPPGVRGTSGPMILGWAAVAHLLPVRIGPLFARMEPGFGAAALFHDVTDGYNQYEYQHTGPVLLWQATAGFVLGAATLSVRAPCFRTHFESTPG